MRVSLPSNETGLARAGEGGRLRPASRSVKLVNELLCLTLPLVVVGPGVTGVLGVSADPVISAAGGTSIWKFPRLLQDRDFVIRLVPVSRDDETLHFRAPKSCPDVVRVHCVRGARCCVFDAAAMRFSLSSYETGLARAGEGGQFRPASRSVKLVNELLCLTLPLVVIGPGATGVLEVSADPVISAAAETSM